MFRFFFCVFFLRLYEEEIDISEEFLEERFLIVICWFDMYVGVLVLVKLFICDGCIEFLEDGLRVWE